MRGLRACRLALIDPTPTGHPAPRCACSREPPAPRWPGLYGDALRIRLTAPPVDGAANEALVRFLAERLEVPRSAVADLMAGPGSRAKVVAVDGIGPEEAARRLGL